MSELDTGALARPEDVGLDAAKVTALRDEAIARGSDALVLVKDGRVVVAWRREGKAERIETMSVTKSIASLVVGQLIDEGALSLDDPLSKFFDAWRDDPRGAITLRHVLTHSTGLADEKTTEKIYASSDFVKFALEAKAEKPPGERFQYSNKAVNLLSGVVEKITGGTLADRAKAHLFAPLGIADVVWNADPAGHTQVMAGLELRATDLAKLGQLVVDDGEWCGERVVSHAWMTESTRTYHPVGASAEGLLWWLRPATIELGFDATVFENWRASGMPESFVAKFLPLDGRYFERKAFFLAILKALTGKTESDHLDQDLAPWYDATWKAGRSDGVLRRGPVHDASANGYLGQYLYAFPDERLVAVRMRHAPAETKENDPDSFGDFDKKLRALVGLP